MTDAAETRISDRPSNRISGRISGRISDFEDAANSRWLAAALAPARRRAQQEPSAAAVDRIRARVLGEQPARKRPRVLAA